MDEIDRICAYEYLKFVPMNTSIAKQLIITVLEILKGSIDLVAK